LYVIRRGRRIKRLTQGSADDLAPRYSKSMKGLFFVRRSHKPESNSLMFLPTGTSIPKRLGSLPPGNFPDTAISASGWSYVVKLFEGAHWDNDYSNLACVNNGQVVKTFRDAGFFQIVPGTETVYVQTKRSGNLLFDCSSGRLTNSWRSKLPIWWLNPRKALLVESDFGKLYDMVIYGGTGQQIGKIKPTGHDIYGMTYRLWPEAEPNRKATLIVECDYHMSSGHWPGCDRMDLRTGIVKQLFAGQWLDTNDLGEFLALQYEWIGAYHRGNDRTGHLFLESPSGHQERQLTHYPYNVTSACWAPGLR
jgi:hypothetical protein